MSWDIGVGVCGNVFGRPELWCELKEGGDLQAWAVVFGSLLRSDPPPPFAFQGAFFGKFYDTHGVRILLIPDPTRQRIFSGYFGCRSWRGTAGNILIKDRLPPKKSGRSLFSISAFRDVRFSAFSFCFILSKAGAFTPFAYIQDYALANGVDPKFAAYIMPIMNAAAIPGRIAPGHLGDKFGVFNLIFPSALFGGLCSLAIWLPAKDGPTLMAYTAAYGFFNGQYRKTCVNCGFVAGSKVLRGFGGNGSGRR
ncbi:hypothetical protein BDZ88DRAFT_441990 [Geranomyces variabilis]|nr:hypothetical protein BDZ88DRAFT_441990 [Geranomyces variabilis]